MQIKITHCGAANDWDLDTLAGEVLPRVLSERGLDLATYAGYSYIKPKRVGIDAGRLAVFGAGQEIGYRLIVENRTDLQAKVHFRISVQDSAGKALGELATIEVVSGPGRKVADRISLSLDRNGTYVLAYRADTGQRVFEGKLDFAVVPPEDPELAAVSPFGLHAGHCRLLQAANMRWARNGQIVFAEQLSDRENRDWSTFDQVLHAAERHRITLIPVIQCNSRKRWSAAPLKDYTRFRAFVRDLVAEFKGRQKIWEIVNEPNHEGFSPEQYIQALQAGYRGAKEADPDCTLVMGGTGCTDMMTYIRRLGELHVAKFCDVVNMHPYSLAEPPEGEMLSMLRKFRAWRQRRAPGKPMWSTEIGWMTLHELNGVDQPTLRDYLVRSSILQLAESQDVVLWCPGANRPWDWAWTNSGLYRVDLTPKETYVAFAVLSRLLSGKQCLGSVERGEGVFAYGFEGRGERVEALWRTDDCDHEIKVTTRKPSFLLDVLGNPLSEQATGEVTVPVGATPVFLLA